MNTFNLIDNGAPRIAPAAVFVDATGLALRSGEDLRTAHFFWNFGDGESRYNTLRTFTAAHLYERSGTYTITLIVEYRDGVRQQFTQQVTIEDTVRPWYYVDADGGHDNSDATFANPLQSISRALDMAKGTHSAGVLIALKRGGHFTIDAPITIQQANVTIDAYGGKTSDDMPTLLIRFPGIAISVQGRNFMGRNFAFDSTYGDQMRASLQPVAPQAIQAAKGAHGFTLDRVRFNNVDYGVNLNGASSGALILDCDQSYVDGIASEGIWIEGDHINVIGGEYANAIRAQTIRADGFDRLYIGHATVSNMDRTAIDPWDKDRGAIVLHQGKYAYIADCNIGELGGGAGMGPLAGADNQWHESPSNRAQWVIIERCCLYRPVIVAPGAEFIVQRNNKLFLGQNALPAYEIDAFDAMYNRGVGESAFVFNTIFADPLPSDEAGNPNKPMPFAALLRIGGSDPGAKHELEGNLLVSRDPVIYANADGFFVIGNVNGLAGVESLRGNYFPVSTRSAWNHFENTPFRIDGAPGAATSGDAAGLISGAQFAALPQVAGKVGFGIVKCDSEGKPISVVGDQLTTDVRSRFVIDDFNGKLRGSPNDASGWTVGAIELGDFVSPVTGGATAEQAQQLVALHTQIAGNVDALGKLIFDLTGSDPRGKVRRMTKANDTGPVGEPFVDNDISGDGGSGPVTSDVSDAPAPAPAPTAPDVPAAPTTPGEPGPAGPAGDGRDQYTLNVSATLLHILPAGGRETLFHTQNHAMISRGDVEMVLEFLEKNADRARRILDNVRQVIDEALQAPAAPQAPNRIAAGYTGGPQPAAGSNAGRTAQPATRAGAPGGMAAVRPQPPAPAPAPARANPAQPTPGRPAAQPAQPSNPLNPVRTFRPGPANPGKP